MADINKKNLKNKKALHFKYPPVQFFLRAFAFSSMLAESTQNPAASLCIFSD